MISQTAEMVADGHPDKFCDQVADAVLDACLVEDPGARVAIECLAKGDLLVICGELTSTAQINFEAIARDIWTRKIGYGREDVLKVITQVTEQSLEIARGVDEDLNPHGRGVGAGDQGIMVGYATNETDSMMPREYELARRLAWRLREVRLNGEVPWLLPDGKTQVSIVDDQVVSVVIAAQHRAEISIEDVRKTIRTTVIDPILGSDIPHVVINGTGSFILGGPQADAGVTGRKIVVDAYGPRVPVGGGSYSGKDATKVDRSAAYMARHIAKTAVACGVRHSSECTVRIAYAIGQHQPEMLTAVNQKGENLVPWVKETFPDLSPQHIIDRFALRRPSGWNYLQTATYGHYGRKEFPWE